MVDHSRSALLSLVLIVVCVGVGQLAKEYLAATRQGTLIAGGKLPFITAIFQGFL